MRESAGEKVEIVIEIKNLKITLQIDLVNHRNVREEKALTSSPLICYNRRNTKKVSKQIENQRFSRVYLSR